MEPTAKDFYPVFEDVAKSQPHSLFKVKHALRLLLLLFIVKDLVPDVLED